MACSLSLEERSPNFPCVASGQESCTYVRIVKDVEELVDSVVGLEVVGVDEMAVSFEVGHVHEVSLKHTHAHTGEPAWPGG